MAEEKIKLVEAKNDTMWFKGSPIILSAMQLAVDMTTGDMYTSAKFVNIQPESLRAICFDIICYDEARNTIANIKNVTFSGLEIGRNVDFGFGRRIAVPDINTRNVEFVLVSVTNSKKQVWENTERKRFDTILEQESIYKTQGDYNKQFLDICTRSGIDGTNLVLQPVFEDDHWLCGCGTFNWNDERICTGCGVSRSWLVRNTRIETLEKRRAVQEQDAQRVKEEIQMRAARMNDNKAEQEEFEQRRASIAQAKKKEKRQQTRKRMLITTIILVLLAVGAYCLMTFVFPKFMEAEEYEDPSLDSALMSAEESPEQP